MLTRNLRNKKARYICVYVHSFLRFSLRAATSLVFFGFGFGGSGSRARVCLRVEVIFEKQKENAESVNVCISLSRDVVFSFFFFLRSLSRSFVVFFLSVRPTVYIEVAPPLVNNNATRLHTPQPIVLSFFPLSYRSSSRKKNRSQTPPRDGGDPRLTTLFYTEIERPLKMVKICFTAISLSRWYSIFCWCFCFWVSYIKSVANEWKENLKMFFFILFHAGKKKKTPRRTPKREIFFILAKNFLHQGESLLTCNEVLARIVKSRWLVSGACGRFP